MGDSYCYNLLLPRLICLLYFGPVVTEHACMEPKILGSGGKAGIGSGGGGVCVALDKLDPLTCQCDRLSLAQRYRLPLIL
jgi:hypothetical protein